MDAAGNPVEWLLMIIAQYRDGDIDHLKRCKFREYPGLGVMDDRCETCQQADYELGRNEGGNDAAQKGA